MISSYFRIPWRNLIAHKLFSAINILGLAVGLACFLLISLFVRYEFSYDSFFPNADRIYRLSTNFAATATTPQRQEASSLGPLAPLMESSAIDGVEAVARITALGGTGVLVARDDLASYDDKVRFVDRDFFRIFQFNWLQGDAAKALDGTDGAVISRSMARKYFGEQDPMGATLMLGNTWTVTIRGVIDDIPQNSHLEADLLLSMDMHLQMVPIPFIRNWDVLAFPTYVLLAPGASIERVLNAVQAGVDAALTDSNAPRLSFTPYRLPDIHLFSTHGNEPKPGGSITSLVEFGAIAVALLLVACINFTNLSTARASVRTLEVGMRKTIGATRRQLMGQFLGESFIVTTLAFCIALVLVKALLPAFSGLMDRQFQFNALTEPRFMVFMASVFFVTALAAGSYPALRLSGFQPAQVLQRKTGSAHGGYAFRNILVVIQFALAIALIIATTVVYLQMQYARNFDLGYSTEQMLILRGTRQNGLGRQWPLLKQQLLQHAQISHVTEALMRPTNNAAVNPSPIMVEGGPPQGMGMLRKPVGFNFFTTYGIALVAGRYFDEALVTDPMVILPDATEDRPAGGSYIVNERVARALGLSPEAAVGLNVNIAGSPGPIIGVVEDVYMDSLYTEIQPTIYFVPAQLGLSAVGFDTASVQIVGEHPEAVVDWIREQWKIFIPEQPLDLHFLATDFDALYLSEQREGSLFSFFALLTVVIACLGLLGLATFTVERRTKEIGVRKVMGSSVWQVVYLLTNDFSRLVLLANVIAWPLAYVAMSRWLETFAYRIDLTPLIFVGSGAIALCIAWVTVGGIAAKAASSKPVLALRYE